MIKILIICSSIFTILLFILFRDGLNSKGKTISEKLLEWIPCGIASSIIGFIFGTFFTVTIDFFGKDSLPVYEKISKSYDLVSLDTTKDINGNYQSAFFVGSGFIGEEMYYHFYYKTRSGIKYEKLRAQECFIVETNDKPTFKKFGRYYKNNGSIFYDPFEIQETKKVLYIPKGTIKNNYKVN